MMVAKIQHLCWHCAPYKFMYYSWFDTMRFDLWFVHYWKRVWSDRWWWWWWRCKNALGKASLQSAVTAAVNDAEWWWTSDRCSYYSCNANSAQFTMSGRGSLLRRQAVMPSYTGLSLWHCSLNTPQSHHPILTPSRGRLFDIKLAQTLLNVPRYKL